MGCFSSSNKCCSIHLGHVDQAPLRIQLGSALIALVSAVAIAAIYALQPAGAFPALVTLGAVEGSAFLTFAFASYIARRARLFKEQEAENQRLIAEYETVSVSEVSTVETLVITSVDKDPIEHLVKTIFPPLFDAFENLMKALLIADSVTTGKEIGDKLDMIHWTFDEGPKLFNLLLEEPELYLTELLRCFGRGKEIPSVALRRLVAAYNSGSPAKYAEIQQEYDAIDRGHDFSELARQLSFKEAKNEELLRAFPAMLEGHFCLINDEMKGIGRNILDHIFKAGENNPNVDHALTELRKRAKTSKNFVVDVEAFVRSVFDEAQISKNQMDTWNQVLIEKVLATQFKKTTCHVLGMMARNIRILGLLFDKTKKKETLFPELDTTFLLSETNHSTLREPFQRRLFEVQSQINFHRKENKRVALVALTAGMDHQPLVKLCGQAPLNRRDQGLVTQLEAELEAKIIALSVSVSDHPFKLFKNHERLIRMGAGMLKPFLPGRIKPKLMELVPKLGDAEQARFDLLFTVMIDLFVDPIYDGAIGNTEFREPFERIITSKGEELAEQLEGLVAKAEKQLAFEEIRDVWVEAISAVTFEFQKVYKHHS